VTLIKAENIHKDYQLGEVSIHALRGITIEITTASFVSVIGPSGSGKTTLLNLIGCLDKPTSGSLTVAGTDVVKLDRKQASLFRGANIGFIFQDFNLLPVLTVYENIEYPLLMVYKAPSKERKRRVISLIEAVDLVDQKNRFPDQLSGGQKQRVAIARALVTNPKVVLADEPTANLDHETAFAIINIMKRMQRELGTTFIFSTHDQKIVSAADIIYTLEDGKIKNIDAKEDKNG